MKQKYILLFITLLLIPIISNAAVTCDNGYDPVGGLCIKVDKNVSSCSSKGYKQDHLNFANDVYYSKTDGYKGMNGTYCIDVREPKNGDNTKAENWSCESFTGDEVAYNAFCTFVTGEETGNGICPGGYNYTGSIKGLCFGALDATCESDDEEDCYKDVQDRDDPSKLDPDCPDNYITVNNICMFIEDQPTLNGGDAGNGAKCVATKDDFATSTGFDGTLCLHFAYKKSVGKIDDSKLECPSDYTYFKNGYCYKVNSPWGIANNGVCGGAGAEDYANVKLVLGKYCIKTVEAKEPVAVVPPKDEFEQRVNYDSLCADQEGVRNAVRIVGYIIQFVRWVVPFVIIVLGMIDYGKAVAASDEKSVSLSTKALIRRIIAGVAIFMVNPLVLATLHIIEITKGIESEDDNAFGECTKCLFDPFECKGLPKK